MLPNFSKLSLAPTGEFYALTDNEARALNANDGQDPISLDPYMPAQGRDSDYATFRVRGYDSENKWVDKFFYAEGLWEWVRRPNNEDPPMATLPDRQYMWREDWWALSDRFAPGVPYPHWVRNLPQLDPSKDDTKTYAPAEAAEPDDEPLPQPEPDPGDVRGDFMRLTESIDAFHNVPILQNANYVVNALLAIERGIEHNNYDDQLHHPEDADMEELGHAVNRELFSLMELDNDRVTVGVKEMALRVISYLTGKVALRSRDGFMQRMNDYMEFRRELESTYELATARGNQVNYAARDLRHRYYWNRAVPPHVLVPPADGPGRLPSYARPLNESERRDLARMTETQTGVVMLCTALQRFGPVQFFGQGDDERLKDILGTLATQYNAAVAWPNTGEVRDLGVRLFVLLLSLTPVLQRFIKDPAMLPLTSLKGLRLAERFDRALASALIASDKRYRVDGSNPTKTKLNHFFWRYVSPRYTEETYSQQDRKDIEWYLSIITDTWTQGDEPDPGDYSEDETRFDADEDDTRYLGQGYASGPEEDDEGFGEEPDEPDMPEIVEPEREPERNPDEGFGEEEPEPDIPEIDDDEGVIVGDDVIPRWRLRELEGGSPRRDTPMPSPASVPRYNMRPRPGPSGETPNPRRRRNA